MSRSRAKVAVGGGGKICTAQLHPSGLSPNTTPTPPAVVTANNMPMAPPPLVKNSNVKVLATPTFLIHNVMVGQIVNDLLAGRYQRPSFVAESFEAAGTSEVNQDFGNGNLLSVSADIMGTRRVHHRLNGEHYETVLTNSGAFNENIPADCFYCRLNFTRKPDEALGLPVLRQVDYDGTVVWYTSHSSICSVQCLKKYLDYIKLTPSEEKRLKNNFHLLCYDLYGVADVETINDFELLRKNGGDLDEKEWRLKHVNNYQKLDGPLVIPTKTEYLRMVHRRGGRR